MTETFIFLLENLRKWKKKNENERINGYDALSKKT